MAGVATVYNKDAFFDMEGSKTAPTDSKNYKAHPGTVSVPDIAFWFSLGAVQYCMAFHCLRTSSGVHKYVLLQQKEQLPLNGTHHSTVPVFRRDAVYLWNKSLMHARSSWIRTSTGLFSHGCGTDVIREKVGECYLALLDSRVHWHF